MSVNEFNLTPKATTSELVKDLYSQDCKSVIGLGPGSWMIDFQDVVGMSSNLGNT